MGNRVLWMPVEADGLTEEQAHERDMMKGGLADGRGRLSHFVPEFVGTQAQDLNLQDVLRTMRLGQKRYQQSRIHQPDGKAVFKTDLPVAIFMVGDVHCGSVFNDHASFMR